MSSSFPKHLTSGSGSDVPPSNTEVHKLSRRQPKLLATPRRPGFSSRTITPKNADYERQMLSEIDDQWRHIAYDRFMASFVPGDDLKQPYMKKASRILANGLNLLWTKDKVPEWRMYPVLVSLSVDLPRVYMVTQVVISMQCEAFNVALINTGLTAKDTAVLKESKTPSESCPDVCLYPKKKSSKAASDAYMHEVDTLKSTADRSRHPHMARTAFGWMALPVEAKTKKSGFNCDPSKPESLRNFSKEGPPARVQHATQVAEILLRQHRTHVFSVYVHKSCARIFRWDRAGVIATEPINLVLEPEKLLNFIHRFAKLSRAGMGFDTSARLAEKTDVDALRKYLEATDNTDEKNSIEDILKDLQNYPLYKACLSDNVPGTPH
jgi:hypothetical protein